MFGNCSPSRRQKSIYSKGNHERIHWTTSSGSCRHSHKPGHHCIENRLRTTLKLYSRLDPMRCLGGRKGQHWMFVMSHLYLQRLCWPICSSRWVWDCHWWSHQCLASCKRPLADEVAAIEPKRRQQKGNSSYFKYIINLDYYIAITAGLTEGGCFIIDKIIVILDICKQDACQRVFIRPSLEKNKLLSNNDRWQTIMLYAFNQFCFFL